MLHTSYKIKKYKQEMAKDSKIDVKIGAHFAYCNLFSKIQGCLDSLEDNERPKWNETQVILHRDAFAPFTTVNEKKHTSISFQLATGWM